MARERIWMEVNLENLEEFKAALKEFSPELKDSMFMSFQRLASKLEREFKGTTGFKDKSGKLRRSIFCTATYEPLGLEYGALAPYAGYVEHGHGTWKGGWLRNMVVSKWAQINEAIKRALEKAIKKYQSKYREVK